jgi:hypothetical protein
MRVWKSYASSEAPEITQTSPPGAREDQEKYSAAVNPRFSTTIDIKGNS